MSRGHNRAAEAVGSVHYAVPLAIGDRSMRGGAAATPNAFGRGLRGVLPLAPYGVCRRTVCGAEISSQLTAGRYLPLGAARSRRGFRRSPQRDTLGEPWPQSSGWRGSDA